MTETDEKEDDKGWMDEHEQFLHHQNRDMAEHQRAINRNPRY